METLTVNVVDSDGKQVGTVSVNKSVFGAKVLKHSVHQTVRWQLAKRRAGTHSTLTKGMMSGGGRKPRPQKGSGHARAGSNTSPLWVGGGVSHGPQPRDYEFRINKRTKAEALRSVISEKLGQKKLIVIDGFAGLTGKTKDLVTVLKQIGVRGQGSLIVTGAKDAILVRSASNLQRVSTLSVDGVNVYDILKHRYLVVTKDAVELLEKRVG